MRLHAKSPVSRLVIDGRTNAYVYVFIFLHSPIRMVRTPFRSRISLAMSQKGDDGSQFENYALTLLAAKMVLCEQGNIDIGRCTVPRMLTIVTESFGSNSHARHDRPLGGEVVVDAVAHMKRDCLVVVAVKFFSHSHTLVEVVFPPFVLSGTGDRRASQQASGNQSAKDSLLQFTSKLFTVDT